MGGFAYSSSKETAYQFVDWIKLTLVTIQLHGHVKTLMNLCSQRHESNGLVSWLASHWWTVEIMRMRTALSGRRPKRTNYCYSLEFSKILYGLLNLLGDL
jgi:hypothetical protein